MQIEKPEATRVAIIGAGAAGCFAAANVPYRKDREVVIFEKTGKALQKVKVSGGGRCNTTHQLFDIPELIERYPRGKNFLRKTLYNFGPADTIDWFSANGVTLKAEDDGRMFPITDNSQTIIDSIWQRLIDNKVQVRYHKSLVKIERILGNFILHFADGSRYTADSVLIAAGGFPKQEQYKWLEDTGHTVQSPVPSLFTFNLPQHPITQLMGVSIPLVTIKVSGTKIVEQGPLLITHWGLSGPVVLRASAWGARDLADRKYNFDIQVNWLNDVTDAGLRDAIDQLRRHNGKQFVAQKNPFGLPKRLWEFFMLQCNVSDEQRWGDLPGRQQQQLVQYLIRHSFSVSGKTTFKEEFVTCGGITLSEVNPQTMESKLIPGLFFAGEIMDIDGITGGFNFQHAWASAYIASQAMSK